MWATISELELGEKEEEKLQEWELVSHYQTNDMKLALLNLEKQFSEFKAKNKQATLVLCQSNMTTEQLGNQGLKTMASEFPVISVPVVARDNEFPAFGW